MPVIEHILSLIAPHTCLGCGDEGGRLCYSCTEELPLLPSQCYRCGALTADYQVCRRCKSTSALDQVIAVTPYETVAKQSVHDLKFERVQPLAKVMAGAIVRTLPRAMSPTVVTYIPTATTRRRQRGYDQAALIAEHVAVQLGLPCVPLLRRSGQKRQVGSSRHARLQQLRDALRVAHEYAVQEQRIMLIDDVLTTGSSIEAAARVLRQAGAAQVTAAVFARAL